MSKLYLKVIRYKIIGENLKYYQVQYNDANRRGSLVQRRVA